MALNFFKSLMPKVKAQEEEAEMIDPQAELRVSDDLEEIFFFGKLPATLKKLVALPCLIINLFLGEMWTGTSCCSPFCKVSRM